MSTPTPHTEGDEAQAVSPSCPADEHYFASNNVPHCPLWVRQCMSCGAYDTDDMNQQLQRLIDKAVAEARQEAADRFDDQVFRHWGIHSDHDEVKAQIFTALTQPEEKR